MSLSLSLCGQTCERRRRFYKKTHQAPPSRKRPPTSQAVDDEDEVAPKAKRPLPESFQTQEEVDRLVGEVMRLVNGPLPDELLRAVWKLPLEGQHSILSDIVASEGRSCHRTFGCVVGAAVELVVTVVGQFVVSCNFGKH